MEQFNNFLILLDSNLSGSWWFPALLIGTGIFFTIYLGFPQFKYFKSAFKIVSGKNKSTLLPNFIIPNLSPFNTL